MNTLAEQTHTFTFYPINESEYFTIEVNEKQLKEMHLDAKKILQKHKASKFAETHNLTPMNFGDYCERQAMFFFREYAEKNKPKYYNEMKISMYANENVYELAKLIEMIN